MFRQMVALILFAWASTAAAQVPVIRRLPEQRQLPLVAPAALPPAAPPIAAPPRTILSRTDDPVRVPLRLDEVLRESLERTEIVRVLSGVTAVSSGRTIYDPAIINTTIDRQQGFFDPVLSGQHTVLQNEQPLALFDPTAPAGVRIDGSVSEQNSTSAQLTRRNLIGGQSTVRWQNANVYRPGQPLPLNPLDNRFWEMSYVQPLLAGAGWDANATPIVLARINTQRSFFQLKDGLQELLRSTIAGYWNLMTAEVELWARRQQVQRAREAAEYARANLATGRFNLSEVAQSEAALAGFEATLIAAQANLLDRDAALRNVLGLPPDAETQLSPVTAPTTERLRFDWNELVGTAEQQRPDIIELKLVLAADEQLVRQADNAALPQVDTVMLYRWNGLDGELQSGARLGSEAGQFADWQLGVNFSVPLGLRSARAGLRQQQLILARDRANLEQSLHQLVHQLALTVRRVDQLFAQYQAYAKARAASFTNLEQQSAEWRTDRVIFLNFLQALEQWGNNVSTEAAALAQYNIALADLETQTGTILETHGVRLWEERFGAISPWGRLHAPACYPRAVVPGENQPRYSQQETTSEEFFDLRVPRGLEDPLEAPRPRPIPPP